MSAEWYIGQVQRKIYQNEPLKMSIPLEKYESGQLNYVYVVPKIETEQRMTDVLDFVASDSSQTKLTVESGEQISYIPVNKIRLENANQEPIHIELNKKGITKGDLAFYDIISSNQGKRPICFSSWVDAEEHGLRNNLIFEGLVYRLSDQKSDSNSIIDLGKIDTERLYNKLMKRCNWNNLANPNVYFDWHHRRMFASMQIRNAFYRLAGQLTDEKQDAKALEVLKKLEQVMPLRNWPVDYQSILQAALYNRIGQKQLGRTQFQKLANSLEEELAYFSTFPANQKETSLEEAGYQLSLYNELIKQAADTLSESELKNMKDKLMVFAGKLG